MTPDTAAFLLELVNSQQLHVGSPNFEYVVGHVIEARKQLEEIAAAAV